MNTKLKIASNMLYISVALLLFIGIVYSFTPKIMPYHEKIIGMSHEQLDPKIADAALGFMRAIGILSISFGITLTMLIKGFFSKGNALAWWIILSVCLSNSIPITLYSLSVSLESPWWLFGINAIIVIIALTISKSSCTNRQN